MTNSSFSFTLDCLLEIKRFLKTVRYAFESLFQLRLKRGQILRVSSKGVEHVASPHCEASYLIHFSQSHA